MTNSVLAPLETFYQCYGKKTEICCKKRYGWCNQQEKGRNFMGFK